MKQGTIVLEEQSTLVQNVKLTNTVLVVLLHVQIVLMVKGYLLGKENKRVIAHGVSYASNTKL